MSRCATKENNSNFNRLISRKAASQLSLFDMLRKCTFHVYLGSIQKPELVHMKDVRFTWHHPHPHAGSKA